MSYSFNVRAASRADAKLAVAAELDKVVAVQPIHAADRAKTEAAASEFIDLLADPGEGEVLSVSVSGSVGKSYDADEFTSAGVSVSVHLLQTTA